MAHSGGQVGWDDGKKLNYLIIIYVFIIQIILLLKLVTIVGKRGPRSGTTLKSAAVSDFFVVERCNFLLKP